MADAKSKVILVNGMSIAMAENAQSVASLLHRQASGLVQLDDADGNQHWVNPAHVVAVHGPQSPDTAT